MNNAEGSSPRELSGALSASTAVANANAGRGRHLQTDTPQLTLLPKGGLFTAFWILVAALLGYCVFTIPSRPFVFTFSALLVTFFALLPAYLWCRGSVAGLPILPFFASSYVPTHALQFMFAEPELRAYSDASILRAGLTVSAFLLVATLVWWYWVRLPRHVPIMCRSLDPRRGTNLLLLLLGGSVVVTLFTHAGWLAYLPGELSSTMQKFFSGLTAFAVFILAMSWGGRGLRPGQVSQFIGLFIAYCIAEASSLFLVSVVMVCLMFVLGFIISRQSIPWLGLLPMLGIIGLLHMGKGEMRSRYWAEGGQGSNIIQPWNYPAFYAEWFISSIDQLVYEKQGGDKGQDIFRRVSILDILLEAQDKAPKDVPFLKGKTYAIIPSALVPRMFNSGKASPHESTTILNMEFDKQTLEAAQSTTIGWGMLNEAYANFGYAGCLALAVVLGTFYGLMTRAGIGLPPTSIFVLVGMFTLSFTLQTTMTAAIYITSYLQGLLALLILTYPFTILRPLSNSAQPVIIKDGKNDRRRRRRIGSNRPDKIKNSIAQ